MRRLTVFLFLASIASAKEYHFLPPHIPAPKIVEAIPPPQTHVFAALDVNNAFTGNNTHSGTETFTGPVTTGNFNNIRIIDGTKFAKTGAGINAADADLGAGTTGEIWIPSGTTITTTDAQISVGSNHVLRVFGSLNIAANSPGPILLGKYAKLACVVQGGNSNNGSIVNVNATAATQMVRATVQDGSLETMFIEGCYFYGGNASYSNGVLDISGMNDKGWVRDNIIAAFNGGYGIFFQDIQSGAAAGTSNSEISGNWIVATAAGQCMGFIHSATNAVIDQVMQVRNNECQATASTATGAAVVFQNTSAGSGNQRYFDVESLFFQGWPVGQPCITINGLSASTFRHIECAGNGPCINIPNSAVNQSLIFEGIHNVVATNTLVDTNNSVTLANPSIGRYMYLNTNALTQTYDYQIFANYWNFPTALCENNGGGAMCVGPVSGHFRIDPAGPAGAELRFLNNLDAFSGASFVRVLPTSAASGDLGSTLLPFGSLWIGNAATNNIQLTGTATTAKVATLPNNTGTIAELNLAQSWTASQTHTGAAIIPDQTSGITGTTTNNNANAGAVGEYVQSVLATGSSVTLATGVTSNVTSISLTAGDWDVTGAVDFTFGATTSYTNLIGSVSTTTGTIGGQDSKFDFETPAAVPTAGADATFPVPVVRFSLSGTTTVFLVAQGTFTVSTLKAYGTIRARRIR